MRSRLLLPGSLLLLLASCGSTAPHPESAPDPVASADEKTGAASVSARPANLAWWQGPSPVCATGELKTRSLTWGGVHWCQIAGARVDASLQNDLSRLARCVHDSVEAFQSEPEPGQLGKFLERANEAGLNPVLCSAVRRDSEVRTYNGRTVQLERTVVAEPAAGSGVADVRYRFSCEDCLVAAETTVQVAL